MPRTATLLTNAFCTVQMAFMAMAVFAFSFPPVQGRIMLFPVDQHARETMIRLAVANGALLVGPGTLPGSIVVEGKRGQLASILLRNHIIPIATSRTWCGEGLT